MASGEVQMAFELRVVTMSGDEVLRSEVERSQTVSAVKGMLSVSMGGVPSSELLLLFGDRELQDEVTLGEVEGLEATGASISLVRKAEAPWCWPSRLITQSGEHHHMIVFEDPEMSTKQVKYRDDWDSDDDWVVDENFRKMGLLLVPALGLEAGKELRFTYALDGDPQNMCSGDDRQYCSVFKGEGAAEAFAKRCALMALSIRRCGVDGAWTREALQHSVSKWLEPAELAGESLDGIQVSLELLGETGSQLLPLRQGASFAELLHISAAALLRKGYFFEEGLRLWTADGCFALPTRENLKFLQPLLQKEGSAISLVAVPREVAAVAVAGRGVFTTSTLPPKSPESVRVGVEIAVAGEKARLGFQALRESSRSGTRVSPKGRRESSPVTVALSELGEAVVQADDGVALEELDPGSVLQLFELAQAGAVLRTSVRITGDGNMAGGSFLEMAVPADADSSVVHAWLKCCDRHRGWTRLATAENHREPIAFASLSEFVRGGNYTGLCICSC